MSELSYLIFGTGALGTVFGGLLQHAGHDVAWVGRGAHFRQLTTEGGLINGIWGEYRLRPVALPRPQDRFDVVLLCVKSFDTVAAIQQLGPWVTPRTVVISLQNGLGNLELIAQEFGPRHTVGGRVIFGAQVVEPGRVTVTVYADQVLLGALAAGSPTDILSLVAQHLNQAGIPTAVVPDILPHLWNKVLYNCALNPLGAILGVTYGALAAHPQTRELMRLILGEIYQVAAAKGVRLPLATPEDYFRHFLEDLVPPTAAHRPSMWQDLQAGRRTEIEALNGAICRYGEECGLSTPYNEAITRLVRFLHPQQRTTQGEGTPKN
ncbi:MAG: ketopantoate reductase family protein [Desulfobaccales bacterium]